ATGRPAMVGASTTEVTGKGFCSEVRPIAEKTSAHKTSAFRVARMKIGCQEFIIPVESTHTAIGPRGAVNVFGGTYLFVVDFCVPVRFWTSLAGNGQWASPGIALARYKI